MFSNLQLNSLVFSVHSCHRILGIGIVELSESELTGY